MTTNYELKNAQIAVTAIDRQAEIIREKTKLVVEALQAQYKEAILELIDGKVNSGFLFDESPVIIREEDISFNYWSSEARKNWHTIRLDRNSGWREDSLPAYRVSSIDSTVTLDDVYSMNQFWLAQAIITYNTQFINLHDQFRAEYKVAMQELREIQVALRAAKDTLKAAKQRDEAAELERMMKSTARYDGIDFQKGESVDVDYEIVDYILKTKKASLKVQVGHTKYDFVWYVNGYQITKIGKSTSEVTLFLIENDGTKEHKLTAMKNKYVEQMVKQFQYWNNYSAAYQTNEAKEDQVRHLGYIAKRAEKKASETK